MNDIVVVGAGAAGMLAALAARGACDASGQARAVPPGAPSVVLQDGAGRIGLKILASGGGRCNVTNEAVDERDFSTDAPHLLRSLLRAFPVASVRALLHSRGCPLYADPSASCSRSNRAADVLAVLVHAVTAAGITLAPADEVVAVSRAAGGRFRCGARAAASSRPREW
ncbi:MAG: NAD(P)/FAD-dependent oxidoreductase [Planctomycetota bacterium]